MNDLRNLLHRLYDDASKHSVYQSIPDFVTAELEYAESIDEAWRGDRPRLAYLLDMRPPKPGEHWGDFGANTGFFCLSLAHRYPQTRFTAIEANPNHACFIKQVADTFELNNIDVEQRAVGLRELETLPSFDYLLHLNVLHHAGHDFDHDLAQDIDAFRRYVPKYLSALRERTEGLLFQIGSNWGGDKSQPWVGARDDTEKLNRIAKWLTDAGWQIDTVAYPRRSETAGVYYADTSTANPMHSHIRPEDTSAMLDGIDLDIFPGEFYRRPLLFAQGCQPRAT